MLPWWRDVCTIRSMDGCEAEQRQTLLQEIHGRARQGSSWMST